MTDENMQAADAEGVDWGDIQAPDGRTNWEPAEQGMNAPPPNGGAMYPSWPDNPHNHRFTISIAPGKPPMIVLRGNTAQEITDAFTELEMGGVYANLAAADASLKAQGQIGAGLGPVSPVAPPAPAQQGYQAPPAPQGGATPPPFGPNVSVPNAPGYQGPPQQQQGWGPPPPAQGGGWNGGGGNAPQAKPRPAGWAMVDVPFNDKDRFKALRAQGTESGNYLRGKIQWGGKGVYWLDPSVAAWVAQQGFPVMQ